MDYFICSVVTGVGATVLVDCWAIVRRYAFGIALPNYGLVGRWFAHLFRGRLRHESISASATVAGEALIGWIAHYVTGVAFAGVLLGIWGLDWVRHPTIGPALLIGVGTVAAPFLILQPGMGAGVAASRTQRPNAARMQSLVTHGVFGLGLYGAGWMARLTFVS